MPNPVPALEQGLAATLARSGVKGTVSALERLSGGASMESWAFICNRQAYVLRRASSPEVMANRQLDHATEAALIRAAHAAGVPAPEVVAELAPEDGIGSGFVMRRIAGTPEPAAILGVAQPGRLLAELAATLVDIHRVPTQTLPPLPRLDPAQGVETLAAQFAGFGGDRPIVALGLSWLRRNLPAKGPEGL